jgi:methylglyoxal/glyoxal reductase
MQTITLNNGIKMPILGLGTFKMTHEGEAYEAVKSALEAGYRHIDTAMVYRNEEEVGQAIRDSKINREEIFVTTKCDASKLGYESAKQEFQKSLDNLGLDYVDLYLIHWPSFNSINLETWRAFEELYEEGKVRALGLSNFTIHHLDALLKACKIKPTVNQVECHPGVPQWMLQEYCDAQDIKLIAHTTLMRGDVFKMDALVELANKYQKSISNVVCRWLIQRGILVIPKSSHQARIVENMDVFSFELTEDEMTVFNQYANGRLYTMDPCNHKHYTNYIK